MASYLIFIKGANTATAKNRLIECGLEDLGIDNLMITHVEQGPNADRNSGALCGWLKGSSDDPVMIVSDSQTWLSLPANGNRPEGEVWIGFEKTRPIRPKDLARKQMMPGTNIRLRDGQEWLIPAAQQLPRTLGLGSEGEIQREVETRYRSYFDRAFKAMQEVFRPFGMWNDENGFKEDIEPTDEIKTITIEDGTKLACEALSINYRLNYEVALMLGLLDENCLVGIVACTFDMPDIFQVDQQKKKEEEVVSIPVTSLT